MVSPSTLFSLYFGWLSIVDGFSAVPSAPTSLPEGTTAAAGSGVNEEGGVHDTAARKRTGKKSFLHRQALREKDSRTHPPKQIATAIELDDLAASLSQRTPGSHNYYKGYIHYRSLALDAIRHELSSNNLPHPANRTTFENLFFRLGVASDVGSMPSFEDPGARSGYAVEFFCRARNLADSFLDAWNANYDFPEGWVDGLRDSPLLGGDWDGGDNDDRGNDGDGVFSMVSLGGGPGFDYVSAALATTFSSHGRTPSYPRGWHGRPEGSTKIHATILDYEEGWGDLVRAMAESTRTNL